jgi:AraC family transcriptional activator of pobA
MAGLLGPTKVSSILLMEGFKVYELAAANSTAPATGRRDCYRIYLLGGVRRLQRADQELLLDDGPCLYVGNPYPVEFGPAAGQHMGYACLFTEAFVRENGYFGCLEQWMRLHNQAAVFPLKAEQAAYLSLIFERMLATQDSAYQFKNELLHNCLQIVMHEALRYRPPVPRRFRFYSRSPAGVLRAAWQNRW